MIRLAVRVRREQAQAALAALLELAPTGMEEVDVDSASVDYVIYGSGPSLPPEPALRAALGDALLAVDSSVIADDWADRWRDFHKPLVLGTRLSVRPPWEPAPAVELDLVIDPGRAFGTGAHATTRLCLEALLDLPRPTEAAAAEFATVDLGCGSGVLAIAAAKLGFGPVLALDYDQLAVDATAANAQVNGVERDIRAKRFDLIEQDPPGAPLVLANLLGPLLTAWIQKMPAERIFRPEVIILSGVLATEADRICSEFAGRSFFEERRLTLGEWSACVLRDIDTR